MAAAAGGGGGGDYDLDLPLEEVGALLASFSGDAAAVAPVPVPVPEAGAGAGADRGVPVDPGGVSGEEGLWQIERFLMDDVEVEAAAVDGADEFVDAVLAGDQEGSGAGGGSMDEASAREDGEVAGVDANKKRTRLMRNRDSAMKSRERKKMYVKDLEMKSKYLEAECQRLRYTLHCCASENVALRQCFLKDRPVSAPTAKQGSAVPLETLLLVSLLGLVSILCLFLMPSVTNRSLVARSSHARDLVVVTGARNTDEPEFLQLIRHGRRCKSTRARIKPPMFSMA
ncbi:hypothetical protein GUJ93_ZPchr0006g45005 [Zizania palustris]|uniref:BZIP domain-containing protein n=1 Tax=Zizania palustris TaxID=103762 RepID=A0A8J5TAR4_ZIZPA|nr:hypothetical protein GUJ93_ZPchr0006g45005 [Zizania palustris]